MKKAFVIFSFLSLFLIHANNSDAQSYTIDREYFNNPWFFEAGVSLNAMNCLTDLGGKKGIGKKFVKDIDLKETHIGSGVFFSVTYQNAVALRLEGTFGQISGSDNALKGINDVAAKGRLNRNLNFRSNITEISSLLEIHPLNLFGDWSSNETDQTKLSPYLLAGIGYYSFNPQAKFGNVYVDLQPLKTEGQGFVETGKKEYSLNQINIPMGAGVKYEVAPQINLRLEFLYRKLFTDYLDDVSGDYVDPALFSKYLTPQKATLATQLSDRQIQPIPGDIRGLPKNDTYFSANLKLSVVIGRKRTGR